MKQHTGTFLLFFCVMISQAVQAYEMRVQYGYIIGLEREVSDNSNYHRGGAIIGGLLGYWSGEGQSGSNKALRALAGSSLGSAISRSDHHDSIYRYAVQLENNKVRYVVMDQGSFSMGDCVAIEHGRLANLRRVANVFCEHEVPDSYQRSHVRNAKACELAKQEVLNATTEENIKMAALKMQVLCVD